MFEAADGLRAEFAELERRLADPATHTDLALARKTWRWLLLVLYSNQVM